MTDYTKLDSDLAALDAKLDAFLAKASAPAPAATVVDEQPAVDALAAKVEAISNKIPA